MIAVSFLIFGVHDWAARIPIALSTVLLCWVTARFAAWGAPPGLRRRTGLCSGIVLATSVGCSSSPHPDPGRDSHAGHHLALWSLMRAIEEDERHPARWAMLMWGSMEPGCC